MQHSKVVFSLIILLFVALAAKGQIANSPLSQYGIGAINNDGLAQNQGMGGIGISNPSLMYVNNINPALLVFNHVVTFQGGLAYEKRTVSDGKNSQSSQNANLNYLVVSLPAIRNRWTTSVGLMPYSNVDFNISSSKPMGSSSANYPWTGKGGLTQFYWSNGVVLHKNFSIGSKIAYTFGSINSQGAAITTGTVTNGLVSIRDAFGGVMFSGGASYHKDSLFHRNYKLNIGVIGTLQSNIKAQHSETIESVLPSGAIYDSVSLPKLGGKLNIPASWGAGISFGKADRWTVGADFNYYDYRKFQYRTTDGGLQLFGPYNGDQAKSGIGYRTGVGAEVTPKAEDFTNYLNRVTYRVGASYEQSTTVVLISPKPWIDVAGTFGVSLPVGNRFSNVDIGVKIGKLTNQAQSTLRENYFRIYFGVTFNDTYWFIKRKFD